MIPEAVKHRWTQLQHHPQQSVTLRMDDHNPAVGSNSAETYRATAGLGIEGLTLRGRRKCSLPLPEAAHGLVQDDPIPVLTRFAFTGRIRRQTVILSLDDAIACAVGVDALLELLLGQGWPAAPRDHRRSS